MNGKIFGIGLGRTGTKSLQRWHFSGRPGDLLELPVEAEYKWEELCEFLGREHPGVPYPHEHKGDYRE